jgi:hypothetical protein
MKLSRNAAKEMVKIVNERADQFYDGEILTSRKLAMLVAADVKKVILADLKAQQ